MCGKGEREVEGSFFFQKFKKMVVEMVELVVGLLLVNLELDKGNNDD